MQDVEAWTTPLLLAQVFCTLGCHHCWIPSVALTPPQSPLRPLPAKEGKFLTLTSQARWRLVLEQQGAEVLVSSCWDFPASGRGSPPSEGDWGPCKSVGRTRWRKSLVIGKLGEALLVQRIRIAALVLDTDPPQKSVNWKKLVIVAEIKARTPQIILI